MRPFLRYPIPCLLRHSKRTELQYSNLSAEDLEAEARRAMREWMFHPGPVFTFLKSLTHLGALRSAFNVAFQQLKWTLFPNAAH